MSESSQCRARQGEPQSEPPSRTSFLSLSREIRDFIYELALVSSSPIIAWSGMPLGELKGWQEYNFGSWNSRASWIRLSDYRANSLSVQQLAPNLLRCHPVISHEAALIFYSRNAFRITGEFTWDTVVDWLQRIGPRNQAYLTALEINITQPQHVWQLRTGERTPLDEEQYYHASDENKRERVYPRNRLLRRAPHSDTEGVVENISPAIETLFKLLGGVKSGPKLTISLMLGFQCVPGTQRDDDKLYRNMYWFTMDMPNVIERCREIYTATQNSRSVEVLWRCQLNTSFFETERRLIESTGWEIVDAFDTDDADDDVDADNGADGGAGGAGEGPDDNSASRLETKCFTLRRKRIDGLVEAYNPPLP